MLSDPVAVAAAFEQAAFGMCDWDDVLISVADATRSRIGQLVAFYDNGILLNVMAGTSRNEEAAYFAANGQDPEVNVRTRGVLLAPSGVAITESDFTTRAEVERSEIYQTLFRHCDVPTSLQVRTDNPGGLSVALCMQRPKSSGSTTADERRFIEALSPTVSMTVAASLRLGRKIDDDLLVTAENIAGPALILGPDMKVLSLSPPAESILGSSTILRVRGGRLACGEHRNHDRLAAAFRSVAFGPFANRATINLTLSDGSSGETLHIDICPMPPRMSGPLSQARALLVLRQVRSPASESAIRQIERLLGLTPAEAQVALHLARGMTLVDIARKRNTSVHTARAQLRTIFDKTGCRRQAELALAVRALVGDAKG